MALLLRTEQIEDGYWIAECTDTPGCWGEGDTEQEAMDCYCDVLLGWVELKQRDGDDDIPPMDLTWTGRA